MVAAIGVDDPEIRVSPVRHDVGKAAHVDDALAIRRNLRIGRVLEIKDVFRFECRMLGLGSDHGGCHQHEQNPNLQL
jgi:hypothetical protein